MKYNHSTLQNVLFSHNYLLRGHRIKYGVAAVAVIVGSVASSFMLTTLPAFTIALLGSGMVLSEFLMRFSTFLVLLCSISVIHKRIESSVNKVVGNDRMRKIQDYYGCIATVDYEKIDSAHYRTLFDAGLDSYYDGFHKGFHHILTDSRNLVLNCVGLIVYSISIAQVEGKLSIFLIAISTLSIFFNRKIEDWIKANEKQWLELDTKIKYMIKASTASQNAKDIRIFQMQPWLSGKMRDYNKDRLSWNREEEKKLLLGKFFERILTAVKYMVAFAVVLYSVGQGLSVEEFVLTIGLILGINQWIVGIFDNIRYLQFNGIHVEHTRKVLDLAEEQEKDSFAPLEGPLEIDFDDVSFTFPDASEPILKHFNLHISAGEKIALVGNNGAGKSTLVKLLCGLYTPTAGSIKINGLDQKFYGRRQLFKLFSIVFQDINILSGSILENVSCHPQDETDEAKVLDCVEKAGLLPKVQSLSKGLHTVLLRELDKEGVLLSGGERQKLMIARCLYKDSSILILDEPTAALDAITEDEIYRKYHELTKNKTSIFISHRLNSTKFCNRVILLDKGEILEEGSHQELMQRKGAYAEMYEIQSSYYKEKRTEEKSHDEVFSRKVGTS